MICALPSPPSLPLCRIVTGGQSGADRAVLDWALEHQIAHGGWCPRGRRAEDGPIDRRYQLHETPSKSYHQRTEWNVRDSDGTVVLSVDKRLGAGSKRTLEFARRYRKPALHLHRTVPLAESAAALRAFIEAHGITTLHIAGSRASEEPGIGAFTQALLDRALAQ